METGFVVEKYASSFIGGWLPARAVKKVFVAERS